jgi:hypothetical protein
VIPSFARLSPTCAPPVADISCPRGHVTLRATKGKRGMPRALSTILQLVAVVVLAFLIFAAWVVLLISVEGFECGSECGTLTELHTSTWPLIPVVCVVLAAAFVWIGSQKLVGHRNQR